MRFYSNALIKKYFKETSSYVKYEEPNEVIIFFTFLPRGVTKSFPKTESFFFSFSMALEIVA